MMIVLIFIVVEILQKDITVVFFTSPLTTLGNMQKKSHAMAIKNKIGLYLFPWKFGEGKQLKICIYYMPCGNFT